MTNTFSFNDIFIGVGDKVKITTKTVESGKARKQIFIGTVIKIKGDKDSKSFTVRRIGANLIGIERIFPVNHNIIEDISVTKEGLRGSKKAKLYYIRDKSKKDIERIYSRNIRKNSIIKTSGIKK